MIGSYLLHNNVLLLIHSYNLDNEYQPRDNISNGGTCCWGQLLQLEDLCERHDTLTDSPKLLKMNNSACL